MVDDFGEKAQRKTGHCLHMLEIEPSTFQPNKKQSRALSDPILRPLFTCLPSLRPLENHKDAYISKAGKHINECVLFLTSHIHMMQRIS